MSLESHMGPKIRATIWAGFQGQNIGGGADLVFGKENFSGRLVTTSYQESFIEEMSELDMNMRPGPSKWLIGVCGLKVEDCHMGSNPGRTYRFYTGIPEFPFGFGLSY